MQIVVLVCWLSISHMVLMLPGAVLLEHGKAGLALLFVVVVPVLRIARRFRGPRGYYLLGYGFGPGGDATRPAGWISRTRKPALFQFAVFLEVIVVGLLIVAVLADRVARVLRVLMR